MKSSLRCPLLGSFLVGAVLIIALGCDGKNPVGTGTGSPFSQPIPPYHASEVPLVTTLVWSCSDTTLDSLSFALYFGTTQPPPLSVSLLTDTTCHVGPLLPQTTYYWQVVAFTPTGDTLTSPIWKFTTTPSFVFPLEISHQWSYVRKHYSYNFDPPSIVNELPQYFLDTLYATGFTEIERLDTLLDTVETYVFHTIYRENSFPSESYTFRNNTADGFYTYAYTYPVWVGPPKIEPPSHYLLFDGMKFRNVRELSRFFHAPPNFLAANPQDSITYESPPVRDLAYPLEVGTTWFYRRKNDVSSWDMKKEVVSIDTLQVPAGSFVCFKIRWYWDIDDDGEWDTNIEGYDYFCSVGIVKRVFLFYDITLTGDSSTPLGTCDIKDEYILTSYGFGRDR